MISSATYPQPRDWQVDDDEPRTPEAPPPWPWLVGSPMARRLEQQLQSDRALPLG